MKIILVRHAKTKIDSQIPITRWGLSQEGISLAQKLSENNIIKHIAIESIVKTSNNKENIGLVSHGNILTLFSAQFKQINSYTAHKKIKYPDVAVLDWDKKEFINFFGEII